MQGFFLPPAVFLAAGGRLAIGPLLQGFDEALIMAFARDSRSVALTMTPTVSSPPTKNDAPDEKKEAAADGTAITGEA